MKRTLLIVALIIGLGIGLSVSVAVIWYFTREQEAGPAAAEIEPIDARAEGAGGNAGGNNVRAGKFADLDVDQDGRLSPAEFGAGRKPAEAAKWFERRDADHDGFISREEFLPFSAGPKAR